MTILHLDYSFSIPVLISGKTFRSFETHFVVLALYTDC